MRKLTDSELMIVSGSERYPDMNVGGHTFADINIWDRGGSATVDGVSQSFNWSNGTLTWGHDGNSISGTVMQEGGGMLNIQLGADGAGSCMPLPGNWESNEIEDGPDPANVGSSKKYR